MKATQPLLIVRAKKHPDSFRMALEENKGHAFFYLDNRDAPDDLVAKITAEYREKKTEFLISTNGELTGVYGPDAHWLIPRGLQSPLPWIRKHLTEIVSESQSLSELPQIKVKSSHVFQHHGDLGDIVAALPVIRQLGGGYLILGNRNGVGAREPMTRKRFDAIAPLLAEQPYITGVHLEDDTPHERITHDFSRFREHAPRYGYNLATWQADYFGVGDLDLSPWLTVKPNPESNGLAIFARTVRYHNPEFQWVKVVERHAGSAMFVGLEWEWEIWSREHQAASKVSYRPTANLLEVAELIAGSLVLVANQTCTFWIGAALGHRLIQETDIYNLNSVVPRENATYFSNGVVDEAGNPVWTASKKRKRV